VLRFILTFLTYREVFGQSAGYEALIGMLRGLRKAECLVLLAKINTILANETSYNGEVQHYLKSVFFRPDTLKAIIEAEKRLAAPVLFSELQILNLAKLAILHCSNEAGNTIETPEDREHLGICCLMMNDLIAPDGEDIKGLSRKQQRDYLIQESIRNLAFQAQDRFDYTLPRYYELMFDIPNSLKGDPQYMDIPGVFHEVADLELLDFFSLGFAVLARWLGMKIDTLADHPDFFLNEETWFRDAKMPANTSRKIFDFIRLPVLAYQDELDRELRNLRSEERWQYSHLSLEKYPVLQINGMDICLSLRFLMKKITENVFWVINDGLKDKERSDKFREFFGKVFEEYVRRLLRRTFRDRCLELRYGKSNQEAGDGIVVYPNDMILFEAKSARLFLHTARSGDLGAYERNLRDVLIRASTQLDRVIKDFKSGAFDVPGLKRSEFNRFHPVIVTVHSFPQEPLTWEFFQEIIVQHGLFQDKTIARPHLIDIEELEMAEGVLEEKDLLSLLNDKNAHNELRDVPFKNYLFQSFRGKIRRNKYLSERYHQLGGEIRARLFGTTADNGQVATSVEPG